jgi:hypothetical protein
MRAFSRLMPLIFILAVSTSCDGQRVPDTLFVPPDTQPQPPKGHHPESAQAIKNPTTHPQTQPAATQPATTQPTTQPCASDLSASIDRIYDATNNTSTAKLIRGTINVLAAMMIGFLGAGAYYIGVYTGFIERSSREYVLLFLSKDVNKKPPIMFYHGFFFFFFGGVVAAIFQWAQADTLAPIQAFVLGITWPSVVSRSMSGQSGGGLAGDVAGGSRPGSGSPPTGPSTIPPTDSTTGKPPATGTQRPTAEVTISPRKASPSPKAPAETATPVVTPPTEPPPRGPGAGASNT